MTLRSLEFIEIDLPRCELTWRVSPCAAEGGNPCYNTFSTCQDRDHFDGGVHTLRLCVSTEALPLGTFAYPVLMGVSFTPQMISLGKNLGTRASLTVSLADGLDTDIGFDPYVLYEVETGLALSASPAPAPTIAAYSGAIRQNEALFSCDIMFPERSVAVDSMIFRAGTGTWLGLKDGELRLRVGALVITAEAPLDDDAHTISWDVLINPGRIRLWVDGVLVGIASQALTLIEWSNNAAMGYLSTAAATVAGESNVAWATPAGASALRIYYGGQLSRSRPYDPFSQGTLWGRFKSRYKYMSGVAVRWIIGTEDQALESMETRHFLMESMSGPTPEGLFSIIAKDALKLADGDRAIAPRPVTGRLLANIDASVTSAVLTPAGIGNAEYPASGYLNFGGREVVSFTRSGNNLALVRGRLGTPQLSHEAGDSIQTVLAYSIQRAADIARDLLVNYASVPPQYIPIAAWREEDDAYLNRRYTRYIAEPTPVKTLLADLIQQASLSIFWDDILPSIEFRVLRDIETGADLFTSENIIDGSFSYKEQPQLRLSSMLIKYAQASPLDRGSDDESFRAQALAINENAIEAYGSDIFSVVRASWIPQLATNTAFTLAAKQLGRFEDPPRRFKLSLFRGAGISPELGGGYRLEAPTLQQSDGTPETVPVQVVWIRPTFDKWDIEAEEVVFRAIDLGDIGDPDPPPPPDAPAERTIVISATTININLRSIYSAQFSEFGGATLIDPLPVHFIINSGVWIGSGSTGYPSINVGSWPAGLVNLKLTLRGQCRGAGGNGGYGGVMNPTTAPGNGHSGGPALYTRFPLALVLDGGLLAGGGGGGGGASTRGGNTFNTRGGGGGGGAGHGPGVGGDGPAEAAEGAGGGYDNGGAGGWSWTKEGWWEWEAPNQAVVGGRGGNLGQPGGAGTAQSGNPVEAPGAGGAAGAAIDGNSYVVRTGTGTVLGPQIN